MLGVQHQRNMHRLFPALRRLFAMQQMQEVTADGIVIGFWLDAFAVVAVVIPVEKNRAKRRQQFVGNIPRTRDGMTLFFWQRATERGDAGAHNIHRVRRRG